MIKLALTDLDSTLIPVGAPYASWRTIEAIHRMLDAGLHFGPVTGRVPAANGIFIDILPLGWSKGKSVEVLAEHLGIGMDEIAAFGDSENDLSMLGAVTHSVAVANATAEVKAAARWHIGACADDAVADALIDIADAAATGSMPRFMC